LFGGLSGGVGSQRRTFSGKFMPPVPLSEKFHEAERGVGENTEENLPFIFGEAGRGILEVDNEAGHFGRSAIDFFDGPTFGPLQI
jgi:hypothetical protein